MAAKLTFEEAIAKASATPEPFRFIPEGDYLELMFGDAVSPFYEERVDHLITVFRNMETAELVGCKIKGVSLLMRNVRSFIGIEDGEVEVRLLLLSIGPNKAQEFLYDLNEKVGSVKIPASVIKSAASLVAA